MPTRLSKRFVCRARLSIVELEERSWVRVLSWMVLGLMYMQRTPVYMWKGLITYAPCFVRLLSNKIKGINYLACKVTLPPVIRLLSFLVHTYLQIFGRTNICFSANGTLTLPSCLFTYLREHFLARFLCVECASECESAALASKVGADAVGASQVIKLKK